MLAQIRQSHLFFLVLVLKTTSVFATDPALAFRGTTLGDKFEKVQQQLAREFARVEVVESSSSLETPTIRAGDNEGVRRDGCSYMGSALRPLNCVVATFRFSRQLTLHHIFVMQSFNPPVSLESLVTKFSDTYGVASATFREHSPAYRFFQSKEDAVNPEHLALMWGGKKIPVGSFITLRSFDDTVRKVDGKYVSISIYHKNGLVYGYALRIYDTQSVHRSGEDSHREAQRQRELLQKKNDESVKF